MKRANLYPDATSYTIHLNEVEVAFVLKRNSKRRYVGLRVDHHGLTVTAPTRSSEHFIRRTLADHADWIVKKLKDWSRYRQTPLTWRDGDAIPFLGEKLRLTVLVHERAKSQVARDLTGIVVASRRALDPDRVRELVIEWYRGEARAFLPQRLRELATRAGLRVPRFFLTNADGRWGSCNAKGDIRLNWRLMKAPHEVIDYVAAHELAHLKYMDHSAAFWRTVAEIYPDYDAARRQLQQDDVFYRSF